MKKILFIIFMTSIIVGCKKEQVDLTFGKTPEERILEENSKLKSILVGSEYGWIGVLDTDIGGGYGLFMHFRSDETLQMIMDGNTNGVDGINEEIVTSTYRVKHVMNTSLLFDTYSPLALLQDPVPGQNGGKAGKGLGSDVDFELVRYSTEKDTIYLKGKKYHKTLKLYKAKSVDKDIYLAEGGFSDRISRTNIFFNPVGANYFELGGKKVQVSINNYTKKAALSMIDVQADTVVFVDDSYGYSVYGFDFVNALLFQGQLFMGVRFEDGDYYIYDSNANKYLLKYSNDQVISLKYAIGTSIKDLVIPGNYSYSSKLPLDSWSTDFASHWNSFVSLSKNSGYSLTIGNAYYTFDAVNKRINVSHEMYQSTTSYIATYQYSYEFTSEGNIKFKAVEAINGNGGIIVPYMNSTYHTKMLSDTFEMSYDIDSYFGKLVKFKSKENPDYFFTMVIK